MDRLLRTAANTGLLLATMDVREHAAKHHQAVGQVLDRMGTLPRAYAGLSRTERLALATPSSYRNILFSLTAVMR